MGEREEVNSSNPHTMFSLTSRRQAVAIVLAQSVILFAGCRSSGPTSEGNAAIPATIPAGIHSSGGLHADLVTDKGTIGIELYANDSPTAVENFRLLAERGYYNGLVFHRIVKGFMIQGGDPTGTGSGGKSAWGGTFPDGIREDSVLYKRGYKRGIVAMANIGPDSNGSQFFIMLKDYPLPSTYVIFGNVTRGIEVLDALADTPTVEGPDGEMSKPVTPPVLRKVTILP